MERGSGAAGESGRGDVPQGGQRERVLEVAEERANRALREAAPREQHVRERARGALHEVLLHQVRQAARRIPASTRDTLSHRKHLPRALRNYSGAMSSYNIRT